MQDRQSSLALLSPSCRGAFEGLAILLESEWHNGKAPHWFLPFETYRSPERQEALYIQQVTRARAWQSAHQVGMAVDFVIWDTEAAKWSWDSQADWAYLKAKARQFGLDAPIQWDRVHVEAPHWQDLRNAIRKGAR